MSRKAHSQAPHPTIGNRGHQGICTVNGVAVKEGGGAPSMETQLTLLPPGCLQAFSNPQLWATSLPVTIKSQQEQKCCLLFHPKWISDDGRAGQFSNSYRNKPAFFPGDPQAKERGSSFSQPPSNLTKPLPVIEKLVGNHPGPKRFPKLHKRIWTHSPTRLRRGRCGEDSVEEQEQRSHLGLQAGLRWQL